MAVRSNMGHEYQLRPLLMQSHGPILCGSMGLNITMASNQDIDCNIHMALSDNTSLGPHPVLLPHQDH